MRGTPSKIGLKKASNLAVQTVVECCSIKAWGWRADYRRKGCQFGRAGRDEIKMVGAIDKNILRAARQGVADRLGIEGRGQDMIAPGLP